MMIVSFTWMTNVFLAGCKTVTRRFWDDDYAFRWWCNVHKDNDIFQAWDRSPRFKGKLVGMAKCLEKPYRQPLNMVTDEDEIKEGGLWGSGEAYIHAMSPSGTGKESPYVINFNKIGDMGYVSGNTRNTITDFTKNWKVDSFIGIMVKMLSGKFEGRHFKIKSNDTNTLTVEPNCLGIMQGDRFYIEDFWKR